MTRALALVACCAAALGQDPEGLSAAREPLGRLVRLDVKDGRLRLDRSAWARESNPAREADRRRLAALHGLPVDAVPEALADEGDSGALPGGPQVAFEAVFDAAEPHGASHGQGGEGGGVEVDMQGECLRGRLAFDACDGTVQIMLEELSGPRRRIDLDENETGLTLFVGLDGGKAGCLLLSPRAGRVVLVAQHDGGAVMRSAESFDELLLRFPDDVHACLLGPLDEMGILAPPSRFLPAVIAVATSAFGAEAPDVACEVDSWVARLSEDDPGRREEATENLKRLFPRAVRRVQAALDASADPEVRSRLQGVIGAHPAIARAIPWVKAQGLHEDRAWLLQVMTEVPAYRASARARLAELLGRDYGDDPSCWPRE